MRCLINPSGERSHAMSSAGTTFGRVAYSLRNACERAISSARQLQVLSPERANFLSSIALMRCGSKALSFYLSEVVRRRVGSKLRVEVRRPFHHLLQQQVH